MREATTSPVLRCGICARPARGAAAARHPWVNLWPRLCAACRRWLPDLEEPQRAAIIAERRRQQAGYYEAAAAVDPERARELAAEVAGARGDCWRSAWEGWARIPGGVYVEGFMAPLGRHPIAHGWVEDADGVVLDVAMPGEGAVYVAGARYIGQHALHVAHVLRGVPFHARFPAGFLGRTTMFAAERACWRVLGSDVGPSAIHPARPHNRGH